MSSSIDIVGLAERLRTLESIAIIQRVSSTNELGRRVIAECIENDIPIPRAILVAREQLAGRGRNSRMWHSPAGKGIYATTILSLPLAEIALLPLAVGNIVALYLQQTFGIPARIKWPNDILVGGRKIGGILIEAKSREREACLLIGTGINVSALGEGAPAHVISISEVSAIEHVDLDDATTAFIEFLDAALGTPLDNEAIVAQWRRLTVHENGDRIQCVIGDRAISGTWAGIDESGRALIRQGGEVVPVSAGDVIVMD